jgi:hypothetical protein
MNRLIVLAALLAFSASGTASATSFYRAPAPGFVTAAKKMMNGGIVNGNGTIDYGSGFQVQHTQTGEYVVSFGSGVFKSCPVISVTPAGTGSSAPLANIFGYSCSNSGVQFTVLMIGIGNGQAEDNAFHFIAIVP